MAKKTYASIADYEKDNPQEQLMPGDVPKNYAVPGVHQLGNVLTSKYDKNIVLENLDRVGDIRAHRQGKMAQLGNALNQAIVGEIAGGTLEGLGYMLDVEDIVGTVSQTEDDWGNWLSDIGKGLRTWTQEATPIYQKEADQGKFNPGSWSWWMSNAPSVASTLSLMIPAAGAVKGVSMLGKAMNISQKMGKTAKWMTTGLGQATVSRYMENMMEASQVFESKYEEFVEGGMDEQEARKNAAKGAQFSWNTNWAMMAQDLPQYLALNRLKIPKSVKVEKALKAKGLKNKLKEARFAQPYDVASTMVSEGIEEGFQFVVGEEAERVAELASGETDDSSFTERLGHAMNKGEFWSSAFMGALGGGVFATAGKKINDAILNSKGILTEEQRRVQEIEERGAKLAHFAGVREEAEVVHDVDAQEFIGQSVISDMAIEAAANGNTESLIEELNAFKEEHGILDSDIANAQRAADEYTKAVKTNDPYYAKKIAKSKFLKDVYGEKLESIEKKITKLKDSEALLHELSATGRELLDNQVILDGYEKSLKYIKMRLEKGDLKQSRRELYKIKEKFYEARIAATKKKNDGILEKDPRTNEEKNTDKDVSGTVDVKALGSAEFEKIQTTREYTQRAEDFKNFSDKEYQRKDTEDQIKRNKEKLKKDTTEKIESSGDEEAPTDGVNMDKFDNDVKGTEAEGTVNEAKTEALNKQAAEAPNVTETTGAQIGNRYEGREFLLATEMDEIEALLQKEGTPAGLMKLLTNKNNSAQGFADFVSSILPTNTPETKKTLSLINEYYAQKAKSSAKKKKEAAVVENKPAPIELVTPNTPDSTTEDSSEAGELDPVDVKEKVKKPVKAFSSTIFKFLMDKTMRFFEFHKTTHQLQDNTMNRDVFKVDFDFLDKPGNVAVDDEIYYEVDLTLFNQSQSAGFLMDDLGLPFEYVRDAGGKIIKKDGKDLRVLKMSHEDMMHNEIFQRNALIRIVHKKSGKVIGTLPRMDQAYGKGKVKFTDTAQEAQLQQLRNDIFTETINTKKTKGEHRFSIGGKVDKIHAGRFWTLSKTKAQEMKLKPTQVLTNDQPFLLGIGIMTANGLTLHVPNQKKMPVNTTVIKKTSKSTGKFSAVRAGITYLIIQNSAGEWVPFRLYNEPVIGPEGLPNNAALYEELMAQLESSNTVAFGKVQKAATKVAYLEYEYNKETDTFTFTRKNDSPLEVKRNELRTNTDMIKLLQSIPLQISSKEINRRSTVKYGDQKTYNEMVSSEGRLWTNLHPNQHTHSSRIDVVPYAPKGSVPVVPKDNPHDEKASENKAVAEPVVEYKSDNEDVNKTDESLTPKVKDEEVVAVDPQQEPVETKPTTPEVKPTTKPTPKAENATNRDNNQADSSRRFSLKTSEDMQQWDRKKEEAWFKSRFPNVPFHVFQNLKEVLKGGELAWGTFYNAAVYISDNAATGTTYHEAFHAVFNLYLSEAQQKKLLAEEASSKPLMAAEVKKVMDSIEGLTEQEAKKIALEERMAEKFKKFVETEMENTSWGARINRFFKGLWAFVRQVVFNRTSMQDTFILANSWSQKFRKPIPANVKNFKSQKPRYLIKEMNSPGEQHRRVVTINDMLITSMNSFIKSKQASKPLTSLADLKEGLAEAQKDYSNYSYHDLAKEFGIDFFYREVEQTLVEQREKAKLENPNDPYIAERIQAMIDTFIVKKTEVTIRGKKKIINKYGKLGELAARELAVRGIKTKIRNDSLVTKGEQGPQAEQPEDIQLEEEEQTRLEGWQVQVEQMSGKDSLSKEIRTVLSQVPIPKTVNGKQSYDKFGKPEFRYDDLGFPMYYDFDRIYNTLKRDLADLYSAEEISAKLAELSVANPEYNTLIERLENDSLLKTKFTVDFMKAHMKYFMVTQDESGRFNVFNIARRNSRNIVLDNWSYALEHPLPHDNFVVNSKGEIRDEQVDDISQKFEAFVAALAEKKRTESALDEGDFLDYLSLTERMGLDITYTDLEKIIVDKGVKGEPNFISKYERFEYLNGLVRDSYISKLQKGTLPHLAVGETKRLKEMSDLINRHREELFESSILNIDNKKTYAHIPPNFMTKMIAQLKKGDNTMVDNLLTDPFYQDNLWLQDLIKDPKQDYNAMNREEIEFVVLDGYKEHKRKGKKYTKLNEAQVEAVAINQYLNNNVKGKYGFYAVPIFADAPVMGFVKFLKNDNTKDVVKALFNVAIQEQTRMNRIKNSKDVAFMDAYKRKNEFIYLPSLNKDFLGKNLEENKEAVMANIEAWLEEKYSEWKTKADEAWAITGDDRKISTEVPKEDLNEFLKQYYFDSFFASIMISQLTSGDEAFYKSSSDFQKRNKQLWSPGLFLNTTATYTDPKGNVIEAGEDYNNIYVDDVEVPSKILGELKKALQVSVDAKQISSDKMYSILASYGYKTGTETRELKGEQRPVAINPDTKRFFFSKDVNVADGQSYITMDRFRKVQIGLGRWNDVLNESFERIKDGGGTINDMEVIMNPMKPFMYQLHKVDGVVLPTQHKNSEFIVTPQLAYRDSTGAVRTPSAEDAKNGYKDFQSPTMAKILHTLEGNNETGKVIDAMHFESVVKAGLFGKVPFKNLGKATVHTLDNRYYRLQQETPPHHIDDENIFGTQTRKLIFADIPEDAMFKISGIEEPLTKRALWDKWNQLISKDLEVAYDNVRKEFLTKEGIQKILLEEVRSQNLGEQFEEALQLVDGDFKLPLYHPLHSKRLEALVTSVFRNRITKQKIHGGSFVQVTNFGFSDELNLKMKDGALEYAEVAMPWTSKKYFQPLLDDKGFLDPKKLNKEQQEMLKMIGYRIPTEDKYSLLPMKVVKFLPQESGASIMLPSEITTIAGSDFDIDKLFVMIPNFNTVVDKAAIKEALKKKGFNHVSDRTLGVVLNNNLSQLKGEDRNIKKAVNALLEADAGYKLQTIEKEKYDLDDIEGSSRAQRANGLQDIMWSIMTHQTTFHKFINPGGFDNLKKIGNIITLLEDGNLYEDISNLTDDELNSLAEEVKAKKPLNLHLRQDWVEQFTRNMTGKELISVFANHNTAHAVLQWSEVEFNNAIMFDGHKATKINGVKTIDGQGYISRVISSFLSAAVDNAKDPIASIINMSLYTADTVALLASLGYSETTIFSFTSQPIIKELNRRYYNYGGHRKAEAQALVELTKEIGDGISKYTNRGDTKVHVNLNTNTMLNNITTGKKVAQELANAKALTDETEREDALKKVYETHYDYFVDQLNVLRMFKRHSKKGAVLNDIVSALKFDRPNGSLGPTLARSEFLMEKIDKAMEHEGAPGGVKGLKNIIPTKQLSEDGEGRKFTRSVRKQGPAKSDYPTMDSFYENGLDKPVYGDPDLTQKQRESMTEEELKAHAESRFDGISAMFPWFNMEFKAVKKRIMENSSLIDQDIGIDEIEFINYQYLSYLSKKFTPLFDPSDKSDIINNFPAEFTKAMRDNPRLKEDEFLRRIAIVPSDDKSPIPSLRFDNTGSLSSYHKDMLVQHWEGLLGNKDPKMKEIGEKLVKYVMYTHGFGFNPFSFGHLIPVSYYTQFSDFNTFLKTEVLENNSEVDMTDFGMFIDQFYRNHWYEDKYVTGVNRDLSNISGDYIRNKKGAILGFLVDPTTVKDASLFKIKYEEITYFAPYVKANISGVWYLFKHTEDGVYEKVSKLGIPHRVTEYTAPIDGTMFEGTESVINANRVQVGQDLKETQQLLDEARPTAPHGEVPEQILAQAEVPFDGAPTIEVSITSGNYTRKNVEADPETAYVFTENTHSITAFPDRQGGGSAIIRGLSNAYAIVTKKKYDYNTRENVDYQDTDADFKEFTEVNTKLIAELKALNKPIVFPKGFASDKAKLPTRFAEWLQTELKNNFGLETELNANKTGLISKSVTVSSSLMIDSPTLQQPQGPENVPDGAPPPILPDEHELGEGLTDWSDFASPGEFNSVIDKFNNMSDEVAEERRKECK